MIKFERSSLWESVKYKLSKKYRAECDANRREAIRWLMENPAAPCSIDGNIVPNGFGTTSIHDYLVASHGFDSLQNFRGNPYDPLH